MTKPEDGPWDDATAHDDARPFDADHMDGDDPPTTRATIGDHARVRSASRDGKPRTQPPPIGDRLPAPHAVAPPPPAPPITSDTTAGSVAIVATGSDAERVRKLCHANGLLVPVVAALGAVDASATIVVIGEPALPAPARVAHIARPGLPDDALLDLLRALVSGRVVVEPPVASPDADARVGTFAERIGSLDDRGAIEMIAIEAITALTQADRAQLLYFNPATGALWSEARRRTSSDDRRAAAGLAGWCAHTGHAIAASPAGDDPRYATELDDPDGKAQTRLLVQPVIGADRRTHAVLVAARRWRRNEFVDADRNALRSFAARIAPAIDIAVTAPETGDTRKRGTLPRVAAVRLGTDPATMTPAAQSAIAAPPRPASDSRPPPVTARRADSKPPPIAAAPAPLPVTPAPPVVPDVAEPPRTPTDSGIRNRSASDSPKTKRKPTHGDDPIDIAILATAEDDIARVRRIAKKARLEVSVLARADEAPPYYRIVMLGEAWTRETDPRVAYAARSEISDDHLAELVVGLSADRAPAPLLVAKPHSPAEARRSQTAIASSRRLAVAVDLCDAERLAVAATRDLVDADPAHCLYYARETGALWSETRRRDRIDDRRAIAGVVGWTVRTGKQANVARASADPRYLAPIDDPDGDPNSQLLVQPIVAADRRVLGALVAVRRAKRPPFTDADVAVLEQFAALASPFIEQLQLAAEAQQLLAGDGGSIDDNPALDSPIESLLRRVRTLPRWSYAIGGAVLMLLVVLVATC